MEIMNDEKTNDSVYSQIELNDIIECINNDFDAYLIAIKSTYQGEAHWIIIDQNDHEAYAIYIGNIVIGVLNHINHHEYPQNPLNNGYSKKLIEIINNKKKYSLSGLSELYDKYRYLAFYLYSSKPFRDFYDGKESCSFTHSIKVIGKNYDKDEFHEQYRLNSFCDLFMLDLWEVLFSKKSRCKIKYCQNCNTTFWTPHKNQAYCPDCKDIKSKIDYQNYCKNNEANALVKSIHQRFFNKIHANEPDLQPKFDSELHYYQDIIQEGKSEMKVEPYYRTDIKTDESYY